MENIGQRFEKHIKLNRVIFSIFFFQTIYFVFNKAALTFKIKSYLHPSGG